MAETAVAHKDSEDFLEASLISAEEVSGRENPTILGPLNAVAEFHLMRGAFGRAEELYVRAAEITSQENPTNSERIKLAKQKLAWLKFLDKKNDEAEALFLQALDITVADPNASEDSITQAIRSLVTFYVKTVRLPEATETLKKLLNVYESKQEATYQSAFAIISLAVLADAREDAEESLQYLEQVAPMIKDKCAIGYTVDYLSLAEIINLYFMQDRKFEALELVACTMMECEDTYWPHNPVAGESLSALAEYMRAQKKYKQAESIYKRALPIQVLAAGVNDPSVARLSLNLSNMYLGLRKYADAEPLIKDAMKARVKYYGVLHPAVAACVETYATILRKTKRVSLANKLDVRAREIRTICVAKLDKETAEAAEAAAQNKQ